MLVPGRRYSPTTSFINSLFRWCCTLVVLSSMLRIAPQTRVFLPRFLLIIIALCVGNIILLNLCQLYEFINIMYLLIKCFRWILGCPCPELWFIQFKGLMRGLMQGLMFSHDMERLTASLIVRGGSSMCLSCWLRPDRSAGSWILTTVSGLSALCILLMRRSDTRWCRRWQLKNLNLIYRTLFCFL